jgi:hypothetical protein
LSIPTTAELRTGGKEYERGDAPVEWEPESMMS